MAQIKFTVRNCNTGKVLYSCIKMSGDFQKLYDKLLSMANRILEEHRYDNLMYIYNYYTTHWWHVRRLNRLLCAHGRYYFQYNDSSSISYTYSIVQ